MPGGCVGAPAPGFRSRSVRDLRGSRGLLARLEDQHGEPGEEDPPVRAGEVRRTGGDPVVGDAAAGLAGAVRARWFPAALRPVGARGPNRGREEVAGRGPNATGERVVIHRPGQVVALASTPLPVLRRENVFSEPAGGRLSLALDC